MVETLPRRWIGSSSAVRATGVADQVNEETYQSYRKRHRKISFPFGSQWLHEILPARRVVNQPKAATDEHGSDRSSFLRRLGLEPECQRDEESDQR